MKIIALGKQVQYAEKDRKVIVEMTAYELARISGRTEYLSDRDLAEICEPGKKVAIANFWSIIELVRRAPHRFKQIADGLDEVQKMIRDYEKFYKSAFEPAEKEEAEHE
jgi:hypothetical protein